MIELQQKEYGETSVYSAKKNRENWNKYDYIIRRTGQTTQLKGSWNGVTFKNANPSMPITQLNQAAQHTH